MDTYDYIMKNFKNNTEIKALFAGKTAAEIQAIDTDTEIEKILAKDPIVKKAINKKSFGEEMESITYKIYKHYLAMAV